MDFPVRSFKANIGGIGEVELNELSVKYRIECSDDPTKDTAHNTLLDAGMTEDQIMRLGVSQLEAIAIEVIDFTYPGLKERLGELKDLTPTEKDELKKN
jgi:hypothetical protein